MNDIVKDYLPKPTQKYILSRRKRRIFLEHLRRTGMVSESARAAGYKSSAGLHSLRSHDPEFAKEWDLALEAAADALEDEAIRRATQGVDKPVFYKGQVVGYENHRSDALLMFLLRGNRPDKFGERVNVEGHIKGTFGVAVLPMTAVSSAAWEGVAAAHAASLPVSTVSTPVEPVPQAQVQSISVKR